jgi:hypothetical protein
VPARLTISFQACDRASDLSRIEKLLGGAMP